MTYLPKLATIEQACSWLAAETGEPWSLQRLMEYRVRPFFWLEHHPGYPQLSGSRPEGVMAEMVFAGDLQRLEFDGTVAFVTMFRTEAELLVKTEPGMKLPLHELRFKREEIEATAVRAKSIHRHVVVEPGLAEKMPFSLYLEEGKLVMFSELAHMIAKAMYPSDAQLSMYAVTRITLDEELLAAVDSRALMVRNAAGMGPITWTTKTLLDDAVLLPSDLRGFLRARGIDLVLLPHGSGPAYWTLENAALSVSEQEGWTSDESGRFLDELVDAAVARKLLVLDPYTCLPVQSTAVRQFYELVTTDSVNAWLASEKRDLFWKASGVNEYASRGLCGDHLQDANGPPSIDDLAGLLGWYDHSLKASHWWALISLRPDEAATLLCQQDPHSHPTPEATTTSETTPDDYKILLRAFQDCEMRNSRPRSLDAWRLEARQLSLKYHTWADKYAHARGAIDASTAPADRPVSNPSVAGVKRWTDEFKAEVRAYREEHGLRKTARHYALSEATISKHVPAGKKAVASPFSGLLKPR